MWSSQQGSANNSSNKNNSSISRVISTTSSSAGYCSPPSILPQTSRRSMEEVWKDINPSTLHQDMEADHTAALGGVIDFLTRAFNEPSPASALADDLSLPLSAGLSLNSGHAKNPSSNGGASPAGSGFFAYCSKKRALEQQLEASLGNGNGADRRKKRMIKNRESAARSRARKQAYTHELEQEVAHLLDENRKLKIYCELRLAMKAKLPTKRPLQRASTAPF